MNDEKINNCSPSHNSEALDSVWREIEVALSQRGCPIFYTGHSLGAALATLEAVRLIAPWYILFRYLLLGPPKCFADHAPINCVDRL